MAFVLDASVALAWCFEDTEDAAEERAVELIRRERAAVPARWPAEVVSTLLAAERNNQLGSDDSGRFLSFYHRLVIHIDEQHLSLGPGGGSRAAGGIRPVAGLPWPWDGHRRGRLTPPPAPRKGRAVASPPGHRSGAEVLPPPPGRPAPAAWRTRPPPVRRARSPGRGERSVSGGAMPPPAAAPAGTPRRRSTGACGREHGAVGTCHRSGNRSSSILLLGTKTRSPAMTW